MFWLTTEHSFSVNSCEFQCSILSMKHLAATVYHPLSNRKAESFNEKVVERLVLHDSKHQRDYDTCVELLKYAYNAQVYRSIDLKLFSPILSLHPPEPRKSYNPTGLWAGRTRKTSPHALPAQSPYWVPTMCRNADKPYHYRYWGEIKTTKVERFAMHHSRLLRDSTSISTTHQWLSLLQSVSWPSGATNYCALRLDHLR